MQLKFFYYILFLHLLYIFVSFLIICVLSFITSYNKYYYLGLNYYSIKKMNVAFIYYQLVTLVLQPKHTDDI